jgi:hypothetical protein
MGLRRPEDVAKLRGLSIKQVLGIDLQEAAAKLEAETAASEAPAADEQSADDAAAPVAEPVAVAAEEPAAPEAPAEEPSDG